MGFSLAIGRLQQRKRVKRAKERSDFIDQHIEEDSKRIKRELDILVLGSEGSGKEELIEQMKTVNGSSDFVAEYRSVDVVYENVLDSAKQLAIYMKHTGIQYAERSNKANAEKVLKFYFNTMTSSPRFPPEIAEAIHRLWKDPATARIMDEHTLDSDFFCRDSAPYFLEEVLRIGSPGYIPTETDMSWARQKRVGFTETKLSMGQLSLHVFNMPFQSLNRKWIHSFESVTSIIFCVSLVDYDQVLEGQTQNKLEASLAFFEAVVNSRWFRRTSIILLLNKIDEFKIKLPQAPLEHYFPEYVGGPDIDQATKYILEKFVQANRAKLTFDSLMTQTTNPENFRLLFSTVKSSVKETILQNALKDSGIL